jgi:hypothetical protein
MIFLKRGWGWEMGSFMLYFGQFSVSIENVELFTLKVINVTLGTVVSLKFDPPPHSYIPSAMKKLYWLVQM